MVLCSSNLFVFQLKEQEMQRRREEQFREHEQVSCCSERDHQSHSYLQVGRCLYTEAIGMIENTKNDQRTHVREFGNGYAKDLYYM